MQIHNFHYTVWLLQNYPTSEILNSPTINTAQIVTTALYLIFQFLFILFTSGVSTDDSSC